MKAVIAGAILALVSSSAFAQQAGDGVLDQSGRNIFQFRDANDRISRLAVLQEAEARRTGAYRNGGAGAGGNGSSLGSSTAINNYFQVSNTVSCSGSAVCTGGTNDVRDVTQTTTGSTADADTVLTGNTVRNTVKTTNNAAPAN